MAFDVSKFLALTVLIAGTGAACSGTDDNDNDSNDGGAAGSSTSGKAGQGNDAAGADAGGNGGAAAGGEGGGKTAGGAGAGGEAVGGGDAGGAGGAGGAPVVGECLGSLIVGGAGGAGPDVEPSLEGLCSDFYQLDCSDEETAPSYYLCESTRNRAQVAVAVAVADCLSALSAADQCDDAKVSACFEGVKGRGCANPDGAAACSVMKGYTGCDAIDQAKCEDIADLINPEAFEGFTGCMEPGNEGWYDEAFTGTCVERLDRCAGLVLE
ncbi:MAG TPA: hypothetical protein VHP33_41575 [Polyangiaceae bacterium]|nr:hypothetical protein [Polyangiaceae bacterium]